MNCIRNFGNSHTSLLCLFLGTPYQFFTVASDRTFMRCIWRSRRGVMLPSRTAMARPVVACARDGTTSTPHALSSPEDVWQCNEVLAARPGSDTRGMTLCRVGRVPGTAELPALLAAVAKLPDPHEAAVSGYCCCSAPGELMALGCCCGDCNQCRTPI